MQVPWPVVDAEYRILFLLMNESITQQNNNHKQFNTHTHSSSTNCLYTKDHPLCVWLISPQISTFTVTPNYEILFFSSEISEVVKITDFLENRPVNIKQELKKFKASGESNV